MPTLRALAPRWKALLVLTLLVLSAGFATAEVYVMYSTERADGEPGLSLEDITLTFHGDPARTRLKAQALGPMKRYLSAQLTPEALTPDEQRDLDRLVAWSDAGAPEAEYWDPVEKAKRPGPILSLLNAHGCTGCHSAEGKKSDAPLDSYAGISRFTHPDEGMDVGQLLRSSHTHLLGMGFLFVLLGVAVASTEAPRWLRGVLVVGGLASVLCDVGGWWAVKYLGGVASPLVAYGGGWMGLCFVTSVIVVLFDLLWRRGTASRAPG
jgi:hypothetical protein